MYFTKYIINIKIEILFGCVSVNNQNVRKNLGLCVLPLICNKYQSNLRMSETIFGADNNNRKYDRVCVPLSGKRSI